LGRDTVLQNEPFQNRKRVPEGRGVRRGRSRGDDVEIIADDVGEYQGDGPAGMDGFGESAPLDPGEMFPDGIQAVDVGAGAE